MSAATLGRAPGAALVAPVLIYLVAGIFYVLPSGLPQPADIAFLAAFLGLCLTGSGRLALRREEMLALVALALWTLGVNIAWYALLGDGLFIRKASFWLYNLGVFAAALSLFRLSGREGMLWTRRAAVLALVMQAFVVIAFPEFLGKRQVGTFNNPNQLAYWVLLDLVVVILASHRLRDAARWPLLLAFLLAGWLIMESLSKAGLLAYAILLAGAAPALLRVSVLPALAGVGLLVSGAILAAPALPALTGKAAEIGTVARVLERLDDAQEDESLASRGYFRILDNPHYLLAGAGEGAFWRLSADKGKEVEIHSTPMQFLTSYGLIGCGLFAVLLMTVLRRPDAVALAALAAILAYGIAHNGLRFTHFWIALALIAAAPQRSSSCPAS